MRISDWSSDVCSSDLVYSYLPFMVLPLYANLEKMDLGLLEAAADLGCRPIKAFWVITVPLSLPGIIAGCFLVFIPAMGERSEERRAGKACVSTCRSRW